MNRHYFAILFTLTFFLFVPKTSIVKASDIFIHLSPKNPGEFTNVEANLVSYKLNLDTEKIIWKVGGETVSSGIGVKKTYFRTGAAGKAITVSATAGEASTSITIIPSNVDILWQTTESYVPPFYRGKSLPAPGAQIKLVAIPEFGMPTSKKDSLVYTWKRGGKVVSSASGAGKNTFTITNDYFDKSENISVSVSSSAQTAEGQLTVNTVEPFVIFYENKALLGTVYERALLGTIRLLAQEITLVAEPFFVSSIDKETELLYDWKINGKSFEPQSNAKNLVTLRGGSGGGESIISLTVKHSKKILQSAEQSLVVKYGDNGNRKRVSP